MAEFDESFVVLEELAREIDSIDLDSAIELMKWVHLGPG